MRETNKIMYFIVVTTICIPINAHTDLQTIFYLKVQTVSTHAHVLHATNWTYKRFQDIYNRANLKKN